MVSLNYEEQLLETQAELQLQKQRERRLVEENHAILSAISAITGAHSKEDIFNAIIPILKTYIQFDDAIVLSRCSEDGKYKMLMTSNAVYQQVDWLPCNKFERAINGEVIIVYQPKGLSPYKQLNSIAQDGLNSILLAGVKTEAFESIIQFTGKEKGQFSAKHKRALKRFMPLINRALTDIGYKEQLQNLVNIRTAQLQSRYQEVQKARNEAEQANKAQSSFLATMSHEVRTPLNAVLALIDDLKLESSSEDILAKLNQMESSAELLLVIISDILDLSQVESGNVQLVLKPTNLSDTVTKCLHHFEQRAENKGISLRLTLAKDLPNGLMLDTSRTTQILFNLVSNAIKFTHRGEVNVEIGHENETLSLSVTDTGIGIDCSQLTEITKPFRQVDASSTRIFGGVGLGLSIVNKLVELMGGSLNIESKYGQGSQFLVTIPAKVQQVDTLNCQSTTKQPIASKNILVAEDCETNQKVLELLLARLGHHATVANNGAEALNLMQQENTFDLILMDISMPVMDGIESTLKIREINNQIPIVALTAHTTEADQQRCFDSGMNKFIAKPVRLNTLKETLESLEANSQNLIYD
ncbi:response regulator [Vibrio sp. SCSIO 43136]|uniref:response regulator n=1 Tax=Vibrio sp. SCSIO 43136 TaxID=2819101 RepID=UPI002076568F|nr:response regulator [Vibrio sp. SCSIO 43136]USD66541.1 response regulator [Vibrio sp. SCSIO 43136]